jgi:predicted nucleic acid-binding protein
MDFFDSSTFIAAVSEDDPDHEASARAWRLSKKRALYAHALLETFSILSGGRHPAALTPGDAAELIRLNVSTRGVRLIDIPSAAILDYLPGAERAGVRGGAVYDFMHLAAARVSGAKRIVTLNVRHFVAAAPDLAPIIVHPADFQTA